MGKKGETTRRKICGAAFKLFEANGYTKVTMQDICTACGLSKGGLYRHYEDKRQIFTDVLRLLQEEEAEREGGGIERGLPAASILEGYLENIRQDLRGGKPNINMALYEFCAENKDGVGRRIIADQFERGGAILSSLIEYGIRRGEFSPRNPRSAATATMFLVEGLQMAGEVMLISDGALEDVFSQIREIMGAAHEK